MEDAPPSHQPAVDEAEEAEQADEAAEGEYADDYAEEEEEVQRVKLVSPLDLYRLGTGG